MSDYNWAMIIQTGDGSYLSFDSDIPDSSFPEKLRGLKILSAWISGNAPSDVLNILKIEAGKTESPVIKLPAYQLFKREVSRQVTSYSDNPKDIL